MAAHPVFERSCLRGCFFTTYGHDPGASGMKPATVRRGGRGRCPPGNDEPAVFFGTRYRDRRYQRLCVGMLGLEYDTAGLTVFYDTAHVHDGDSVGNVTDDT